MVQDQAIEVFRKLEERAVKRNNNTLLRSRGGGLDRNARRPTALITGASGGIGLALAHEFARGGHG